MALTIDNATIGYDVNGVSTALNNINTHVITETITQIKSRLQQLDTEVDNVWVGAGAEQFKKNMQADADKITKNLQDSYDQIKSEFDQIVNAMQQADEEMVLDRTGD